MPNALRQRLSATASLAAIIVVSLLFSETLLAQSASSLFDPAAEYVQLTADIEVLRWGDGLGAESGPRPQFFQIHAVVGRDKWVIGELFSGQTNYSSFDGTNIVEWACSFGTNGSTGNRWTRSSESPDGNPSETVRVSDRLDMVSRIAWLAFCSAPTLDNPRHKLYPPWDFWKEYWDPSTFVVKVSRFEDDLGVPKSVLIISGEHQPVLDYRVSTTTNLAGWFFPQSFYLLEYNPTGDKGSMLGLLAHGKVSSIAPAPDPLPSNTPTPQSQAHGIRFVPVSPSKMHIEGTSDVHDWSLESSKVVGLLELDQPLFGPASPQTSGPKSGDLRAHAEFFFPVRGFSSGEAAPMFSNKADQAVPHNALRTTDNPNIVYRLHHLSVTKAPASEASPLILQSTGEVVIAGVTNSISIPIQVTRQDDGLRLSGSTSLKLSDFGIVPPSAQGRDFVIKVGDTIESSFDVPRLKKVAPR